MSLSRRRITPALEQAIVAYVRAGSFPHVAAEAAGLAREVFEARFAQGRAFAHTIRQAHAQARAAAEIAIHKDRPLDWLKSGPGRHQQNDPGWTGPAKAADPRRAEAFPLLVPEVQALIATLLDTLGPYPEARSAVGEQLLQGEAATSRPTRP